MSLLPTVAVWKVDAGFLLGWAAAGCAGYFALVAPARESHQRLQAEQAQLAARQDEAAKAEGLRRDLEQLLKTTRDKADQFTLTLLPVTEQNRRLPELTELAQHHHLEIREQSAKPVAVSGGFARIPIVLVGTSTFADSAAFMHELHRQFPDTQLAGFSLRATPDETGKAGSRALFRFELVWFADPAGAAPQTSPSPP